MAPKAGFLQEYNCTCGATLTSVSAHAVTAHLNGGKHKKALEIRDEFVDFTCKCGSFLTHVKRFQIDQHLAGTPCMNRLAALKQQRCIEALVDPTYNPELAFYGPEDLPSPHIHPPGMDFEGSGQEEEAWEEELPAALEMEEALDMEEAPGMDLTVWVQCPGTHVRGLTEDNFITHYPYGIHKPGGVANCPPISWVPGVSTVWSQSCHGEMLVGATCCEACGALANLDALKRVVSYALNAKKGSDYLRLGVVPLSDLLQEHRLDRDKTRLRVLTDGRKMGHLRRRLEVADQLVVAIRTQQFHRVGALLDQQISRGRSLKHCVALLESAILPITLTRAYSAKEIDLGEGEVGNLERRGRVSGMEIKGSQ
jgi:hypothetical protein